MQREMVIMPLHMHYTRTQANLRADLRGGFAHKLTYVRVLCA
jgi:hypothetical protein